MGATFCNTTGLEGGTRTGGPEFGSRFAPRAAGTSQNLDGGGGGGGGGGSFIGTHSILVGDRLPCPETSEFLAGEFWVFPEPLSDDDEEDEDDEEESDGSVVGISLAGTGSGIGIGIGAGKFITESGDLDFMLVGLKFRTGDAEFDTEFVGEAEFEHGYEAVLELKLLLPKFSSLNTLRELDPVRTGLSFRPEDPLGEKNSSSSPSSSSSFPEEPTAELP
jgi:hypothetical protein